MRWDIGIDLGSAFVRAADAKKGVFVNEPAYMGVNPEGAPFCFGQTAYELRGREPAGVRVARPLRNGLVDDASDAERLIRYVLRRHDGDRIKKHSALMTYSPFLRPAYASALMNAALDAGVSDIALVRTDAASALGSGADALAPGATFVIDIGAGSMTATLLSLGREAAFRYIPYGMDVINERLMDVLKRETGFHIGFQTAENIKTSLASAHLSDIPSVKARAIGYNSEKMTPSVMEIAPELVLKICEEPLRELVNMCRDVIAFAPAELSADLNDNGAVITGGGAMLPGIDKLIGDTLHMPCTIAENPLNCAIRGLQAMMLESDRYGIFIDRRMAIAEKR